MPAKCRPPVCCCWQLAGRTVKSSSAKVPACRCTSTEYGCVESGGTYQERVTFIVQFLGMITQPPYIFLPNSSLSLLVGPPSVCNGWKVAPSEPFREGG